MSPPGPSPAQTPASPRPDDATVDSSRLDVHDGDRIALASHNGNDTAAGTALTKQTSRFTYRQLADLAAAAPACPLRVIAHIDLDAYYAQCEMRRLGTADDTPLVVQQWRSIIAVNYPARAFGISRMISAAEAKRLCPDLVLQHVPTWKEGLTEWAYHDDAYKDMAHHKVSLEPYRIRSREILATIKESLPGAGAGAQGCKLEKAGIDEVFVDLSSYVHELLVHRLYPDVLADYRKHHHDQPGALLPLPPVTEADLDWAATGSDVIDEKDKKDRKDRNGQVGNDADEAGDSTNHNDEVVDWDDVVMLEGARIVRAVRQTLYDKLQFRCSAGIASNKMLSKLGSSQHKPDKQTVLRPRAVAAFLDGLTSVTKLRGLGGKMGARVVAAFDTESIAELRTLSVAQMQAKLNDQEAGFHIHSMVHGIDTSEVSARTDIKSIISAKSLQPPLTTMDQALRWLRVFAAELKCRLLDEKLSLALLAAVTVSAQGAGGGDGKDEPSGHGGSPPPPPAPTPATHTTAHQQHVQRLRLPQTIRLHYGDARHGHHWRSRQTRIPRDGTPLDEEKMLRLSTQLLEQAQRAGELWPCAHLAISMDGFDEPVKNNKSIESFFQKTAAPGTTASHNDDCAGGEDNQDKDDQEDDQDKDDQDKDDQDKDDQDKDDVDSNLRDLDAIDALDALDEPLVKRRRTERDAAETASLPLLSKAGDARQYTASDKHGKQGKQGKQGRAERTNNIDERPRATSSSSARRSNAAADAGPSSVSTFFQPKTDGAPRTGHGNGHDTSSGPFACGQCSTSFPSAVLLQEHDDWHVARALHARETATTTTTQAAGAATTAATTAPTTATRRRGPVKRGTPTTPANSISSFFQNQARSPTKKDNGGNNGNNGDDRNGASASDASPRPLTCQRCGAALDHPDDLQVHQDWHFAKDLETG
ncbi:sister chromatid cohesion protein [Sporothrix brasiliensis 5110]|uniref:DNA polymerase eta n=1 Tax=Sporothrix brasiliensis 5110 TaxID=1398154 RepID=A0A0C2IR88_9PEZI|nr:sister chromatid cohesion protein [Sporothrix brasiliensis 5110]KIH87537.1 sister chromatid cohesion protein [Sporothrix brasiliensis 5110]